eukprot:m51a1_g5490 putative ras-related protein rac1-like (404) ;mRNA; r:324709-326478
MGDKIKEIKCVVVGDSRVGKTCTLQTFVNGLFPKEHVPTVCETFSATVSRPELGVRFRLNLVDTAGHDDYERLRLVAYEGADVFAVCYSVGAPPTFTSVADRWRQEIRSRCPSTPVILVGLKSDMREDAVSMSAVMDKYGRGPISPEEGMVKAKEIGAMRFVEVSAQSKKGLKGLFDAICEVACPGLHSSRASRQYSSHRGVGKRMSLSTSDIVFEAQFWDAPGDERHRAAVLRMCAGLTASVVVFDVFSRQSFEALPGLLEQLELSRTAPKVLVGNKIDFRSMRTVSEREAAAFARRQGFARYFETSALANTARSSQGAAGNAEDDDLLSVDDVFERVVEIAIDDVAPFLPADASCQVTADQMDALRLRAVTPGDLYCDKSAAAGSSVRATDVSGSVDWFSF